MKKIDTKKTLGKQDMANLLKSVSYKAGKFSKKAVSTKPWKQKPSEAFGDYCKFEMTIKKNKKCCVYDNNTKGHKSRSDCMLKYMDKHCILKSGK